MIEEGEKFNKDEQLLNPESLATLESLEKFLEQGYLLHGSSTEIKELEPRQASDTDKTKVPQNQFGVYATRNVKVAIAMALMKQARNSVAYYHGTNNGFKMGGTGVTLGPGFVHVLPNETFEEVADGDDVEIISKVPVVPIATLKVTPEILEHLDISLEGDLQT